MSRTPKAHSLSNLKWSYVFKLTAFTIVVILIASVLLMAEVSRRIVAHLTVWDCPLPAHTPAEVGLANYQTVQLQLQPNQTLTAWYVPSQNGASILLLQGHWMARDGRLPEAVMLTQHGYGVMMLDPHPCLGPGVTHTMGHDEVTDVAAAVEFMKQQPDVVEGKVGIDGFSIGGVIAVESAARNPDIRAVVTEGNFHELTPNITPRGVEGSPVAGLVKLFIIFFYRYYAGADPDLVKPIESVTKINPRPLFLIAGEGEAEENHTLAQFEAAGQPKELWIVPEVSHGGYWQRWPEEYEERVVGFFDQYLLGL
jgi:hypothetical protein